MAIQFPSIYGWIGLFKVGDVAYYRPNESRYAVRKSKIVAVEKKMRHFGRFSIPNYRLTLENGVQLDASSAFETRQEAYETLVKELQTNLVHEEVQLENLKHEMAYERAVLRRLLNALG